MKKVLKWIGIAVVLLIVIGAIASMGDDSPTSTNTAQQNQQQQAEQTKPEPLVVTVDKLMDDLETNALNASNTYKGQYVEVTGRLGVIDSSGKYISLYPINDEFAIIGIQCYITEDQKAAVSQLQKDQQVAVVGTITDVGEVLGYSLQVESIK